MLLVSGQEAHREEDEDVEIEGQNEIHAFIKCKRSKESSIEGIFEMVGFRNSFQTIASRGQPRFSLGKCISSQRAAMSVHI